MVVHAPVAICSKHLLNESQIRSKRGEHSSRQGPRLADLIKVALAALPDVKTLGPLGVLQKQAGAHFWVIHRQQHALVQSCTYEHCAPANPQPLP